MREYEFWRECATGDVHAVAFDAGAVVGLCGPLDASELEDEFLPTFDYSSERAAWADQHRQAFELYRPIPVRIATPPAPRGTARTG
jgi:hypothetical protein